MAVKPRYEARQTVREPVREEVRPGGVMGRDGEMIYRNVASDNILDVPDKYKEDGWDYQWTRVSCKLEADPANYQNSMEAGWRPVRQKAMAGYLGSKAGSEEPIEYKGLMLMERPMEFTIQAQRENKLAAQRQMTSQENFDIKFPEGSRGFEIDPAARTVVRGRPQRVEEHTYPERSAANRSMDMD